MLIDKVSLEGPPQSASQQAFNSSAILLNFWNVTMPNEAILKDKHQQYVNVTESMLDRRRETSAIWENAIVGLAQHLLVIEYAKDKQRIRSCFLQSLLDSLTYRLIYSLYFAQFDSAYLIAYRIFSLYQENTKTIHLIMMIWLRLVNFIISNYKLASSPPKDPGGIKNIFSNQKDIDS